MLVLGCSKLFVSNNIMSDHTGAGLMGPAIAYSTLHYRLLESIFETN